MISFLLAILLVGDLLHPVASLTVDLFLNSNMRRAGRCSRAMPMLLAWRDPDYIAGMNLFDGTALLLYPTPTGCDDENLTQWMGILGGASTWFERNTSTARSRWSVCLE
jgi:hypothetical protein